MSTSFDLIVAVDAAKSSCEFRLLDEHGAQFAYRHTNFGALPLSRQQGLFDLRNYIHSYVEVDRQPAAVAEIGTCIAKDVLGDEIFQILWKPVTPRTLRIHLPQARGENRLAAALARVPWEIARPATDGSTLDERFLFVRMVQQIDVASEPLALRDGEAVRVLFVFAEARGSRPLGARRELQELQRLMEREVYPARRVVSHVLSHGVTRERLRAQIEENGGYHIVHWSGHGRMNALELAKPGGLSNSLSGQDLLDLFVEAGGVLPRLVFLSACHSGDVLRIRDWNEFLAAARQPDPAAKDAKEAATPQGEAADKDAASPQGHDPFSKEETGYTGTAHALLSGGVPCVVAMRYAVGDEYARELGVEFYRALLAHAQPKSIAAALTLARRALREPDRRRRARFAVCDHATPVLYGTEELGLALPSGRSESLDTRDPRLRRIAELSTADHAHFVGRTWELAGFGAEFIGVSRSAEAKPCAVITGLGGMGKTALAAEVLALWQQRFQWVLLYQAKPVALSFEATLSDVHVKLMGELGRYEKHVRANPADAIHRPASAEFTGAARFERLTRNLLRALRDEAILLVIDNFETNLKRDAEPETSDGEAVWAAQDPAWDDCIKCLADELVGTPSRLLITSRWPLAVLVERRCHTVRLGPLPSGEAALYLREHEGLRMMVFGGDAAERALAQRLLSASRFHPLLMDRLARLATGGAALRPQLLRALDMLEQSGSLADLPALFERGDGNTRELAYLNDALAVSIDQLIEGAGVAARRLLWLIALASHPVALQLLRALWQQIGGGQRLPPPADCGPLLRGLVAVGLATEEPSGPDDANPNLTCHELVRERIRGWMDNHPPDRAGLTEQTVRLVYGEWLEKVFASIRSKNLAHALEAGRHAIVYYVLAGAYDRLANLAGGVVAGASDREHLRALAPHLRAAAEAAPSGRDRWICLLMLADGLDNSGQTEESLAFYRQAAALAQAAGEAGDTQALLDYSTVVGNWAIALSHIGELAGSRELQLERARALRQADAPELYVVSSELEALRLDIVQNKAAEALPGIEKRIAQVEDWYRRYRGGEEVPEVAQSDQLDHLFENALDVSRQAYVAVENWNLALLRTDQILTLKVSLKHPLHTIAIYWRNRAAILTQLKRFEEAQAALEKCLPVFANDPINLARTYHALADLLRDRKDIAQAIVQGRRGLALFNTLPDPEDRFSSHHDLALSLGRTGQAADRTEAARHKLASLAYAIEAKLAMRLQIAFSNQILDFKRDPPSDPGAALPRLAEVLADPTFAPLQQWLAARQGDSVRLQAIIDTFLQRAQRAASP